MYEPFPIDVDFQAINYKLSNNRSCNTSFLYVLFYYITFQNLLIHECQYGIPIFLWYPYQLQASSKHRWTFFIYVYSSSNSIISTFLCFLFCATYSFNFLAKYLTKYNTVTLNIALISLFFLYI